MQGRVIISVTNDLGNDQRVHRVAMALNDMGFDVQLVGRRRRASAELAPRPYSTKRFRLLFETGKLFYLSYAIRLFWYLLFRRVDILVSNDLDTLLPNYLIAKLRGKRLVYDSHEYWTEVPELVDRPITRGIWLRLERWLFPKVDAAMTVNQSIADIYSKMYGIHVHVVRNLPFQRSIQVPSAPKQNILLYQGALNVGRGIELMIEAMQFLPAYKLVVAGTGTIEESLHELVASKPFGNQVEFRGFVAPDSLRLLTAQAMLGFSLEEDKGKSYHFALPNKLFDYIQAGVPVLVSDLPEMAGIVLGLGVGEILKSDERTPERLAKKVRSICENADKFAEYAKRCQQAGKFLTWENEVAALKTVYEELVKQ